MKIFYTIFIIFISALIGTAFNELILLFIPAHWALYEVMSASLSPAWNIDRLDLIVMSLNFGIKLNLNILTLFGIIAGCIAGLRRT